MKKRLTILAMLVLTLSLLLLPILGGCTNKVRVFKIYNADDYIDSTILDDFVDYFENKTGEKIKIQYDTFDTLERAYTIIKNREADYDVMCPSDYIIEKMKKNDLLDELDLSLIPNISNIPPFLLNRRFDPGNKYSVPYMWGTVGIMYNTSAVKEEDLEAGWGLLWNKQYNKKILMKDSIRDSVFIATIYAYRDELKKITDPVQYTKRIDELVNNITEDSLKIVEDELRAQYNILYGYEVDSGKDAMTNGEAYLNLAWSGDAVWAIEDAQAEGKKNKIYLDYFIPDEGSNIWFDNWVIPKFRKNYDIANAFINFICDPNIAMRNMEETGYTTAVMSKEIIEYMCDDSVEANDFTYLFNGDAAAIEKYAKAGIDLTSLKIPEICIPSSDKATRLVEMTDFGDKQDLVVKMWTRVKALPLGLEVKIFSICLAIGLVALIAFSIYKKFEKKKLVAGKIEQIEDNTSPSNYNSKITAKISACWRKIKDNSVRFANKLKKKDKTNDVAKTEIIDKDLPQNNDGQDN